MCLNPIPFPRLQEEPSADELELEDEDDDEEEDENAFSGSDDDSPRRKKKVRGDARAGDRSARGDASDDRSSDGGEMSYSLGSAAGVEDKPRKE